MLEGLWLQASGTTNGPLIILVDMLNKFLLLLKIEELNIDLLF